MERFGWQRSKVAAQHPPLLKLRTCISALLSTFPTNPLCQSKPNANGTDVISQKATKATPPRRPGGSRAMPILKASLTEIASDNPLKGSLH
jgi:hypothetical protein